MSEPLAVPGHGVNPRRGSVAAAIGVTRPAPLRAMVFIQIDGESITSPGGSPARRRGDRADRRPPPASAVSCHVGCHPRPVSMGDSVSHHLWIAPLAALALTQIAAIATSVYLHRTLAHRSLRLHPAVDLGFRAVLWLTTGQNRREWVAVHRKHHTFTDREGDPHSPRLLGVWRVQLLNVYYYIREARNRDTIRTFAPDIVEDRWIAPSSRGA